MDAIEALSARLPEQAERIRQRFWRDPVFRSICNDYHDAADILVRLEQSVPLDSARLAEYRGLVAEVLNEANAMLMNENQSDMDS